MAIYAGPAIYFRGPSLVKIDSPKPIEIRLFAASCGALHFSCPVKPTRKNKWDKRVGDRIKSKRYGQTLMMVLTLTTGSACK